MGIFDRISNILKAKTNNSRDQARDLERNFSSLMGGLDNRIDQARNRASSAFGFGGSKAQSPSSQNPQASQLPPNEQIAETEKVFDKMIKEIEQAIEEARVYIAEFTSIENKLYQEKNAALERAKEWKDQAERAILTGRDDIARDALVRKQEFEQIVANYQNQIDSQESVSNQVKQQLQALVNKRAEAKRNRDLLISRQRSLQIQEKMNNAIHGKAGNMQDELERLEKNLMQAEALAEAQAELQGYPKASSASGLPSNLPPVSSLPLDRPVPVMDELSQLENKAVADQQMKEIRERFNPPKPKADPWFAETAPPAPQPKKDVWFDNEPAKNVPAPNLWFNEENKTTSSTPEAKPKKDVWFDEPIPPTREVPKNNIWFDAQPLQQPLSQTNAIKRANANLPNQATLQAGANVSLSKLVSELTKLEIRIGWESSKNNLDLNSSVILTTANGKVRTDEDFIYYNTPISSCRAVKHLGIDGSLLDNEIISLNFNKIPSEVTKLIFSVMIYEAESHQQTFHSVPAVWLRVINPKDGKELVNYLYTNRGNETVLILGEVYLYKGEWKFKAIGQGFAAGLVALLNSYGITVE